MKIKISRITRIHSFFQWWRLDELDIALVLHEHGYGKFYIFYYWAYAMV